MARNPVGGKSLRPWRKPVETRALGFERPYLPAVLLPPTRGLPKFVRSGPLAAGAVASAVGRSDVTQLVLEVGMPAHVQPVIRLVGPWRAAALGETERVVDAPAADPAVLLRGAVSLERHAAHALPGGTPPPPRCHATDTPLPRATCRHGGAPRAWEGPRGCFPRPRVHESTLCPYSTGRRSTGASAWCHDRVNFMARLTLPHVPRPWRSPPGRGRLSCPSPCRASCGTC